MTPQLETFQTEIKNEAIKNRVTGDIRSLFRLEKENKEIKNRVIRDIRNLFEHKEEENCYKPVRVGNFWRNNYIEQKSNGDKNKTLLFKKYIAKIRTY